MPDFNSKKIRGESFGETLRKRRLDLGYSLKQVAEVLQIRKNYLEALEGEDLKSLPSSVYVQGFLRHYARFLKLDQGAILKSYQTERTISDNLESKAELPYPNKVKRISPLALNPRLVKLSLIVLAVVAFFIYLGWELSGFSAPPSLKIISPQDDERINTDFVMIVGQTDEGAEVLINSQPVFIDPKGYFREQIILSEGLNTVEVLAKNKLGRERREERKILVTLSPDVFSERSSGAQKKQKGESSVLSEEIGLQVEIKNSATWISVDTDEVNAFQGTMLPGTSQDFYAQKKISITSGQAGNTYIIFNGEDLGNLGEPGEVVRDVEFTRELEVGNLKEE